MIFRFVALVHIRVSSDLSVAVLCKSRFEVLSEANFPWKGWSSTIFYLYAHLFEEDAVTVHQFYGVFGPTWFIFFKFRFWNLWWSDIPMYPFVDQSIYSSFWLEFFVVSCDHSSNSELTWWLQRSRVQHITDATNSMQRRSGSMLPPPADEYFNNSSASSGKPSSETATCTNVRFLPPPLSFLNILFLSFCFLWICYFRHGELSKSFWPMCLIILILNKLRISMGLAKLIIVYKPIKLYLVGPTTFTYSLTTFLGTYCL